MTEDSVLILKARQGDIAAFEAIYNKYKAQVYRTAMGLVRNADVADEIVQDCFVRIHANLHKLDGERGLAPWLHRVTVNLCYTYLARNRTNTDCLDDLAEALPCGPTSSPEGLTLRAELQAAIQEGLDRLEFAHKTVVILYYLQGFTVEEIAYTLQCPVGTVKSRLFYAREALRAHLAPYYAAEPAGARAVAAA
ncbi:MAG: sigma-70 family RNA polymerase sigma factor [Anaerolineae bacterium]|nr:sigma-70 family RNA polymerase sigma factor [Anaerolineae bacterium]